MLLDTLLTPIHIRLINAILLKPFHIVSSVVASPTQTSITLIATTTNITFAYITEWMVWQLLLTLFTTLHLYIL